MTNTVRYIFFICLFLVFSPYHSSAVQQESSSPPSVTTVTLTAQEQEYLRNNSKVSIAVLDDYSPYSFVEDGVLQGFSIDLITLISEKSGLAIRMVPDLWKNNIVKFQNGEIELIDSISFKEERTVFTLYTEPYAELPILVLTRNDFGKYTDIVDLEGKVIGIPTDIFYESELRKLPDVQVVEFESLKERFKALALGEIDVSIQTMHSFLSVLQELGITNLTLQGELNLIGISNEDLRIGVNKDKPLLHSILAKGLAAVSAQEMALLQKRWFGLLHSGNSLKQVSFTSFELEYLDNRDPIKICFERNENPADGTINQMVTNFSKEYIALIFDKVGKEYLLVPVASMVEEIEYIKEGKCEVVPFIVRTPSRDLYLDITEPYLSFPQVIMTKEDVRYVNGISQIVDKKIAARRGYAMVELLRQYFPGIQIIETDSWAETMVKVQSGEAFAAVGLLPVIGQAISSSMARGLKISGTVDIPMAYGVAVRKGDSPLFSIINKAVTSITLDERNEINNNWTKVTYEYKSDHALLWKVLCGAVLILLFLFFWLRKLQVEVRGRQQAERLLLETNEKLTAHVAQLEKATKEARAANRAKSEFLANMSHELRTPLNAVIGFAELLSSVLEDRKQKSYVESIKTAGNSLLLLINDVLDLSKIEAGKIELTPTITNLASIFEEIRQIFSLKVEKKGLEFQLHIDSEIPESLVLDEVRLRQILLNLVGNAIKFTNQGAIRLTAEKIDAKDDNVDVLICIEDTGIGIQPESIKYIFEAFKQQEGHDSKLYGGTGLGLAISRKLALQMGCDLSVKSVLEEGSVFKLHLNAIPIGAANVSEASQEETFVLDTTTFHEASVLVVDDVSSNRVVMEEILTTIGLKVTLAENGQVALDAIAANRPDLVLMDIRMPVLDGSTATRKIKADPELNDLPVVAVTASSTEEHREEIMAAGFDAYLGKPFSANELVEILAEYLQIKSRKEKTTLVLPKTESFDLKGVKDSDTLLATLYGDVLPDINELKIVMILSRVEPLGNELVTLAKQHGVPGLQQTGELLIQLAESFDTEAITEELEQLASKIGKLERRGAHAGER